MRTLRLLPVSCLRLVYNLVLVLVLVLRRNELACNKIWPKEHTIATKNPLGEVIAGVINTVSRRLGYSIAWQRKNSPQCISVAPDRGKTAETAETTADVVLLTRAGVAHDPILPDAWTFPSHPVPQADVDADTDTIVILQRKRKRQWPASER
ncbi:BZ3501_MvSof-1269-A2-R1_Chr11g02707 [Microbotryum saponariae]|nr:BZ3501_MvSof-1269-A2-R1_Chr11g02707 [Microbotryum saponariae]